MTRTPHRVNLQHKVEVVGGDLTDADALGRCVDGVDAVFLLWTAPVRAAPEAIGRIAQCAKRIVLLTSPHKTQHPFFQQPNPVRLLHAELESLIEESGVSWTFVRPGMFAANSLMWWAPQIRVGDVVRWPYGAAATAPIDERDIAAVAVRALMEGGHDGAEYVLTGPESLTQVEQVKMIGKVLGRSLLYEELSREEAFVEMGFPAPVVTMLLDAWAAAIGRPAHVTTTVSDVTGRPARTFREWITDHVESFSS